MIPLKYQTSNQKFVLGQFLSTDGNTVAAALTINSSDVVLLKHNSTAVSYKSTTGLTHESSGFYGGSFSSDDADTLGGMRIFVHVSNSQMLKEYARVMTSNEYDSYISGTNYLNVTLTSSAYSTLVDMVWDETRSGHVSTLTVGYTQSTLNWSQQSSVVWDEVLTGTTHNIANSAGRRLRQIAGIAIHEGTAAGGSTNTIILDAAASTTTHIYAQCLIALVNGGTGSGQCRLVTEYDGTTKTVTVDRDWEITPDILSEFQIMGFSGILLTGHGVASAGSTNTITLSTASIATNNAYKGSMIVITTGTGSGQARLISNYVAASYIATVIPEWTTTPDNTSIYKIIPVGRSIIDSMSTTSIDTIYTAYVESTETVKDTLMILRAESAGASTGGGGSTAVFYSPNSTALRIKATVSSDGNRNTPTFDLT